MKKYYLIKYNSSNCFEAHIINEEVVYEYIVFNDISGKEIRINKRSLDNIILEEIIEKSDK